MIGDPLSLAVKGATVTVTMPGTNYSVSYQKKPVNPHLVLTRSWTPARHIAPAIVDFRARAFQAAVLKARELGWMV
jgi:hypothetical protein